MGTKNMGGEACILIVEDDIKLLNSTRLVLEGEGYRILVADRFSVARSSWLDRIRI